MDRSTNSRIGLAVTTALASVVLTGCTMGSAPAAESSFAKAQSALQKGQATQAVSHAEAAVLAEPRNAAFRAMLGAAYLEAGRFDSAATSFEDAMALGSEDPRTVLSYALAKTALGDSAAARAKLNEWQGSIGAADYGLAIALAGDADRGVQVLTDALRGGENSAKVRQNLAYTYALAGNWRAARVMASEDVPPDQVDARLSQWASVSRPEDFQMRVASLLNVSPSYDGGQPQQLALSNFPSQGMMVAEAEAQAPVALAASEPAIEEQYPSPYEDVADTAPASFQTAFAEPEPVAVETPRPVGQRYVSNAVVQQIPVSARPAAKPAAAPAPARVAAASSQRRMAIATGAADTHMVQLGSFSSRAVAEAKWNEMQRKFPSLKGREVAITEAKVNGKTFFRVAAAGFTSGSARSMCGTVKSKGAACFAYAASSPPSGAVDRGVRVASRTR